MFTLNSYKKLLGIGLFILCYHVLPAAILPFHARISTPNSANPVSIGLPSATTLVQVTAPWTGAFVDVAVQNKVTLGIDHQNMTFITLAGEIKVRIKLELWAANNTSNTPDLINFQDLAIDYQPFNNSTPYIDKSVFTFKDAYKFRVTIDAITQKGVAINTLPANVFIDADITVERYHDFTTNSSVFVLFNPGATTNLNCDTIVDELEVSWLPMVGAEEYHLEWTFVNDYGPKLGLPYIVPATLPFDFKHNSTRIATTSTSHKITLIFEHGYLLYRVRGIGRDLIDLQKNIVGVWNVPDTGRVSTTVHKYYNTQAHEANKNWQYSATYAEEGKKKEVISYFGGDLRNRQSVTKVNSDKNTIVGETIYDHQGRPAINVLPVPVKDTCIVEEPLKYYPNFNRNDSAGVHSYSRVDFDLDIAGICNTETGTMSTVSGASNYYSSANPVKTGAQAFVPDGEKFPFTQIEYTPDNTGRIRRQGGVGPKYQLGKNHETKYFYGWPNQIQLDRLFGSEVGDAAHYKKNLVVDANGQVSVSYLDQEGRTIATALAGNAPKGEDKTTTILAPLDSEKSAVKQLTIDLFAKNALGLSSVNTTNTAANAIVFNSQLLVAYESEYKFDYALNIAQLTDTCLEDTICFSCVYDLEIKITDDCGQPVTPLPGTGKQPINKTIGHFTADANGNVASFNRYCTGPTPFSHNDSFTLNLPIGNYTISKILTVNSAARDFYVATYLDSHYNLCIKTLSDFQKEALAKIDTASCIVTCASCAKSLQTINKLYYPNVSEARDAYVAAGLGTELEFDYLLEECGAPCKMITWCEATYQQMLLDVSPDGQYAQFQPSIGGQAADWALSVLQIVNILPRSINEPDPNKLAHWKNPLIKVNGSNYEHYLEENGVRSIIHLAPDGAGNYIPAVDDLSLVKLDPAGNFRYTYPENLTLVQDFVNNWKGNWAKSLVQYHPEYCYYESCAGYSVPLAGYDLTSDGFDSLLMVTKTYQEAQDSGLVFPAYPNTSPTPVPTNVNEMALFVYTSSSSKIKDPFYFSDGVPAVTNFQSLNFVPHSMVEVAAITARCGTNYGAAIGPNCKSFGKKVGTDPVENKRILDLEWTLLKNFYLSEKRKVQQKLADSRALTSCYGFNGCIGDTNYNPFGSGIINITGSFSGSPVFNSKQPCSFFAAPFYARKKKRFIGPNDIHPPSSDEMDYQMYLQTGQCPLAIDLQYFITALASRDQLDNTAGENLPTYGEFTNDLYLALSGGTAPGAFIPYLWKATTASGNVLSGNFVNSTSNTPVCGLVLDKTGSGILNWDDIISISQLKYTTTVGTNYEFSAIAATLGSGGAIVYTPIRGSTCLKITGCIFPPQCDANELARDLSALMSALQVNQDLTSSSAIDLSVPTEYLPFLTPAIKKALGTSNVTLRWIYTGNQYELFDANNLAKVLVIKFTGFAPNTFNSGNLALTVKTFNGIESKYQNFFVVKGMNATNNAVVTINGSVELVVNGTTRTGLSMGSCGLPQPLFCQGNEFTLRTDLEALLKDVLLKRPFTGNIDLTQSPYYSNLIQSYFPAGLNGTGSVNPRSAAYTDSLIFSIQSERGDCKLLLHHEGTKPTRYFSDLIGFDGPLTPHGPSAADNNYYKFFIVGIYQPGKSPIKDTIWGESCLPLQICDPCLDGPKFSCVTCSSLSIVPPDTLCQNKAAVFQFKSKGCTGVPDLLWDFGDGTVSSLAAHTYTKAGNYTVTLSTIRRPECRGLLTLVTTLKIVVNDCGQPKPLPQSRVVVGKVDRPLTPALNSQCEALYKLYVNAYRAFEITQRIRRTCKEYKTTSPLYRYEDFVNNGLCSSTEGITLFQNYIQSFVSASPCPGAMPKTTTTPENPCKSAYNAYLTAISKYNEYIAGNPALKLPKIVKILTYDDFIAGEFCYCVEGYSAFLQTIVDGTANLSGNREGLYWQLDIANTCPPSLKPPCDPPMLQDTFLSPVYVPYTNPCVDYQINLAYTNAANAYQLYLDSLTTWIAAKYNEHCLKAFESFTARYEDKEYHFTLYYYDQAGNLVKTIPPEGVVLVTQAAYFQKISEDRTFKQHTFFTEHTMPTTYVYNSLNQLVRQSMPDHDLMDIWDFSLPNGLDPRLKVTATQFVNSTKGYLSGYIDVLPGSGVPAYTRGYLYTTDNGGATWTKMNDLLAADLKKVQMLDAVKGFAVGNHGIVLKTTDGASWDLVSSGVTTTLNDLYFTTASNGVIIGDNGVVLITTDAGLSFSSLTPSFMVGMQLNSITYDGTNVYVGAKDANGQGKLYKGQVNNATTPAFAVTWSASTSIRSTDLVKVQMVAGSTSNGYAIGVDGTLLSTSNGGTNWTTVPTGLSSNFKKVYFKSPAEGVAILEAVAGQGQIYKTTNAGKTWTLISAAGEFYNDFYFYPNTTVGNPPEKGYAVSSDGKVKRIVMSGGYGLVNIVTTPFISSTDKLITVYFSDANRGWVASSTAAYYTSNANSSATTWTQAVLPLGISIKKLYFDQTANSGMVLTTTGLLYRIQLSGSTYTFIQLSGAGENYVDFDDNATEVYAFDKTSQTIKKALKSNLAAGLTSFGVPFPATANLVSINAQVSNTIYTAGSGGDLFKGSVTAWTNNSTQVTPLAIYDVQAAGTNTIYAVGNEGTLLQTSNGSDWKTVPTATAVSLNALKFNTNASAPTLATYTGLIAGDQGLLLRSTVTAGQVALAPILVATAENLYDVALNTSNKAYVAGARGTMVSIPNLALSTPLPVLAVQQSADDLRGLCFIPSSTAVYAVGDSSGFYQYNNSSGAKIKALYTPAFRDVHFTNVQNGYIVGDKGTIRHTADGGLHWQYVPFVNASGGTSIPTLNGVWTTAPNKAVLIGNNKYLANVTGTTVVYNNIGTGNPNLYDVAIKNGKGYLVGANGVAYKTVNNGMTWTTLNGASPPSTTLRAIHLFEDNTFMAVGDKKKIYCYNGAWISHAAPASVNPLLTIFTDVFFHDDRTGYVVGSGGPGVGSTVLRCSFPENIQSSGPTTFSWILKPLTGVNGVTDSLKVDVVTIDFATRYRGFLGGSFNTGAPINYARLLNDETDLFSTRFWYDRLGRMVVSQNTKQFNRKNLSAQAKRSDYSYTRYDSLGRISEVGELSDNVGTSTNFSTIFGEYVNQKFNPDVINDIKLTAWINASQRREVTKTYYDDTIITGLPIVQENLRKRVATVTYEDLDDNNPQTYQHATHYSYDIHGNVKTVLQDTPALEVIK